MPNSIAYLMLLAWPLVSVVLFLRLSIERAIVWSILGGYLFLPEHTRFDLPLVPPMGRNSIPALSVFLICVILLRRKMALWPVSRIGRVLTVLFLFGVVPTVLTNSDPILFEKGALPGMSIKDLFSVVVHQVIVLLPFLVAREYLSTETGMREILLGLALGGLVYSVPALAEVRLSPFLHEAVYGFFQHSFEQMIRDGGFRPIVFLPHALWLALFILTAMMAMAGLARSEQGAARARYLAATVYLAVVLVLCKSLASQVYGVLFVPLLLIARPSVQIRVALLLAAIAALYPMLRSVGLIPVDWIMQKAAEVDPTRASSLGYRLHNEEQLLARAAEKVWFGWGSFGRNLMHDPRSGEILTIPDGRWIIVFGSWGWVGYIAEMGLLALPLVLLTGCVRRGVKTSREVAVIALILAVNMFDMLLNATLVPHTWMIAGGVLGYCENRRQTKARRTAPALAALIGGPRKSRGRRTIL